MFRLVFLLVAVSQLRSVRAACNCGDYTSCVVDTLEGKLLDARDCHQRYCKSLLPSDLRNALRQCTDIDALINELLNLKDGAICLVGRLCTTKTSRTDKLDKLLDRIEQEKSKQMTKFLINLSGNTGSADEYVKCMEQRCERALNIRSVAQGCNQGNQYPEKCP